MKSIILAIDIQNEYIAEGRPFHIKDIDASLLNAKDIIHAARELNMPVWHMQHLQEKNVFEKNNELSNFIKDFEPLNHELVFSKDMYSCFSSQEFVDQMQQEKPDEIVIVGYGSSMCCLCTIIDGIHRGYKFTLIEDATNSRSFPHAESNEMHKSSINVLTQYAKIEKTCILLKRLRTDIAMA